MVYGSYFVKLYAFSITNVKFTFDSKSKYVNIILTYLTNDLLC